MASIHLTAPDNGNTRDETRAKTLQEAFGFKDAELATEQHDAIVFWLDRNIISVASQIVPMATEPWSLQECEGKIRQVEALTKELQASLTDDAQKEINPRSWPKWKAPVARKIWEYPITTERKFVVGFVDLRAEIDFSPPLSLHWRKKRDYDNNLQLELDWAYEWPHCAINFEVKSHIKSAGEVIRQIRLYQQTSLRYGEPADQFAVVSPDTRFADILREQGIGFVEYPGEE